MKGILITVMVLLSAIASKSQSLAIPSILGYDYINPGISDGGTILSYNSFLRLHWGFAIGSPFTSDGKGGYVERATISFDGRTGNISTVGNIGIGKSPATMNLDISTTGDYQGIQLYHYSGRWTRFYSSLPIFSYNGITGANDSGIIFGNIAGAVTSGFVIAPHQGATSGLRIDQNGKVGIGVMNPDAPLAVNGQIHATEVKVTTTVPGPDYVFEPTYHLSPLDSIKTFIDKNKHLPEVPSAKEMEKNGVNLGEMNMLLLKKIEELTLYVIELKKRDEAQQKEIEKLKNK